jgi:hypothetical protein
MRFSLFINESWVVVSDQWSEGMGNCARIARLAESEGEY